MPKPRRVILAIESSRAYGRGCLHGIGAYARNHGPWSILHLERGLSDDIPAWVRKWRGEGVIARFENTRQARVIQRLGLPAVDLRGAIHFPGLVVFDSDPQAVAQVAVNHFLERGFKHFAYCGFPGVNFSDQRFEHYAQRLREHGFSVHAYHPTTHGRSHEDVISREVGGILDLDAIGRWLASLPKPLALLSCNDVRGRQVIDASGQQHIRVPEEIAVLGVDNDRVLCDLSNPPMSSVAPDTHRLGYEGAATLDRMLRGERPLQALHLFPPRGVVTRLSTDILAIEDPDIVAALHFIREHACDGIDVSDVLRHVPISRATLERRFGRFLRRSPKDEIMRVRIERVKQLLRETDHSLCRVAELSGFQTPAHLCSAFKARTGVTPGAFRTQPNFSHNAVQKVIPPEQ